MKEMERSSSRDIFLLASTIAFEVANLELGVPSVMTRIVVGLFPEKCS